jgi:hypothetical protein
VASFPTTAGALDSSQNGNADAFVTKLNASGSAFLYSTFLGGLHKDEARGLALDGANNIFLTGRTMSSDFPTTPGAFDTSHSSGPDAFVTKLTADGSALAYSTYLGDTSDDSGNDIALDGSGNAYVTGQTSSIHFPVTPGAFDSTLTGGMDVFVSKINPTGTGMVYSTLVGGNESGTGESGLALAVDGGGSAYITGFTSGSGFPATPGAFDDSVNSLGDIFVTKLGPSGNSLGYSTLIGGDTSFNLGGQTGEDIAIDSAGYAYVTGFSDASDFPTTSSSLASGFGAFVTKVNVIGTDLVYCTFLSDAGGNARGHQHCSRCKRQCVCRRANCQWFSNYSGHV